MKRGPSISLYFAGRAIRPFWSIVWRYSPTNPLVMSTTPHSNPLAALFYIIDWNSFYVRRVWNIFLCPVYSKGWAAIPGTFEAGAPKNTKPPVQRGFVT
jgi:hypothetical protein